MSSVFGARPIAMTGFRRPTGRRRERRGISLYVRAPENNEADKAMRLPARNCGSLDRAASLVSLNQLYRITDYGLELPRRALARVGEVNLVMEAGFGEVGGVALFRCKYAHGVYGRRLAVIRPGMACTERKGPRRPSAARPPRSPASFWQQLPRRPSQSPRE